MCLCSSLNLKHIPLQDVAGLDQLWLQRVVKTSSALRTHFVFEKPGKDKQIKNASFP